MTLLVFLATLGVFASLAYYLAASLTALAFARKKAAPTPPLPDNPPRVVLLKPVYDLTEATLANLETFLNLDYPRFDVVLGVPGTEADAARALAELRARHLAVNLILASGEEPGCANRKIAKLIHMVEHAPDAEIFVLSDADTRVGRDYLRRLLAELDSDPHIGVVTCAYRSCPVGALASHFEAAFANTDFTPMVILAAALEPVRQAYGATIAFRRTVLDEIGRFRQLKDLLADDFFLGRTAAEHGFKVKLSSALVTIACDEQRFSQFWNHQLRWARTYRTARPISLATILVHGPFWALVLLIATHLSVSAMAAFALVIGARLTMARLVISRVLDLPEVLSDLWLVPIKDLMMTGIWFASLLSNEVLWGGRRFKILPGGTMREVEG